MTKKQRIRPRPTEARIVDLRARFLAEAKGAHRISVCIPARNEAATIGPVVSAIRDTLVTRTHLVDEIIVMDHDSSDGTASAGRRAGALVVPTSEVATGVGPAVGKGDVLWRSVIASSGDLIVWIDADLEADVAGYVLSLVQPLLLDERVMLARGRFARSRDGVADEGGRVTELTARPLLHLLVPELAHVRQPLSGQNAIRRVAAESVPFERDYAVEIGMLLDVTTMFGVDALAQPDLGELVHRHRPLAELHEQARQVSRAILERTGSPVSDEGPGLLPAVRMLQHPSVRGVTVPASPSDLWGPRPA